MIRIALLCALVACAHPREVSPVHLLRGHFQNAYVTRDLARSLRMFDEVYGVRDVIRFSPTLHVTTPHGAETMTLEVALTWIGGYQVELIQPVAGAIDSYTAFLPAEADGAVRLHHIGMRVEDFAATRAEIAKHGWPIAFEGAVEGTRFVYVDARATLGHYLEYVWLSPEAWAAMGGSGREVR